MRSVRIALAAGLAATALATVLVLTGSPVKVLSANSASSRKTLGYATGSFGVCQSQERIPAGTRAIRPSIGAFTGSAISVKVLAGARELASGRTGSGWGGADVTIPVAPVHRALANVRICFTMPRIAEPTHVFGSPTSEARAARTNRGESIEGRMRIEYLGSASSSWLSRASAVAKHMSLGRAWSGTWIVGLIAALMLALAVLTSRLLLRELHE